MSAGNTLRLVKTKTAVVRRTLADLQTYEQEVAQHRDTIAAIRRGTDHSRLKQWEAVLAETQAMIPDSTTRLATAVDDLSSFLDDPHNLPKLSSTPELTAAKTTLASAASRLYPE